MASSHLTRIVYASATCEELARDELDAMLSTWRRLNAGRGVTGFMLYHRASVFQVLEGFPDTVGPLYDSIARDPRQRLVAKLIDEAIAERAFGDWSMGYVRLVSAGAVTVPLLRPFIDPDFRYWQCDEATARQLVTAFANGPWRRSIS